MDQLLSCIYPTPLLLKVPASFTRPSIMILCAFRRSFYGIRIELRQHLIGFISILNLTDIPAFKNSFAVNDITDLIDRQRVLLYCKR